MLAGATAAVDDEHDALVLGIGHGARRRASRSAGSSPAAPGGRGVEGHRAVGRRAR